MDLLDRVRDVAADAPALSDTQLNDARQALLREIARDEARAVRGTRRWIGVGGLVAASAAAAVVIGMVAGPGGAMPAAAEVFDRAADATLTTVAMTPKPGQYIRIEETATYRLGWVQDASQAGGGWWDSRPSETEATVVQSRSLYVPADRSGDWVRDYDESFEVLSVSGPNAEVARPALVSERIGSGLDIEVFPGGRYTEPDAPLVDGEARTFAVDGLACNGDEMPRDPRALAQWVRDYEPVALAPCRPPRFTEPETFNLAPADLRAAMFRALALMEGAKVLRVDGSITTIAYPEGDESDWMETIDIDTTTGLLVGRGNLDSDRWASRVSVSIIDALPDTAVVPAR